MASTWPVKEREEYEAVCSLLRQCGYWVYRLSQARASGQTAGVPDLIAFGRNGHAYVEVKRPDGKGRQSPAQRQFQQACDVSGIRYILGGTREVAAWLGAKETV